MNNLFVYSPKFLTQEQIAKIDELILENKQEYFKEAWKESFFSAMKINLLQKINKLLKKYSQKDSVNQSLTTKSNGISMNINSIFSILGFTKSPEENWLFKQTYRIREEIDMMMLVISPASDLQNHVIRRNIRIEIKRLNDEIGNYYLRDSNLFNKNKRMSYPLLKFINKVKIDFLYDLIKSYIISPVFTKNINTKDRLKNGTTSQFVLIIYYMLNEAGLYNTSIDKTKYADIICFLSRRNKDNVRKELANMFKDDSKSMVKDLTTIRPFFEAIEARPIVEMIDRDLKG